MIVGLGETSVDVGGGSIVNEDVVCGLDVKGLFDFGVGGDEEVEEDEGRDEEGKEEIFKDMSFL